MKKANTTEIYYYEVYTKVYTSNDNINWTKILDESETYISDSTSQNYNINNITTRYIKVEQKYQLNSTVDDINVYFYKIMVIISLIIENKQQINIEMNIH